MKADSHISDATLMAYIDGELAVEEVAVVQRALATDTVLAQRLKRQQQVKAKLRAAFDPVLSEPVPERLLQTINVAGAGKSATVTALSQARAARTQRDAAISGRPAWSRRAFTAMAMAASVVLGVLIAPLVMRESAESTLSVQGGGLVARGMLDRALFTGRAADTTDAVQVGLTFRAKDGGYCRTFAMPGGSEGLACRAGTQWNVEMFASGSTSAGASAGYRQAATNLSPALRSAVEARIEGDTLDADAEAALIARGWQ